MFRATVLGLLLCSTSSWADEPLKIVGYPLETVALYDEQGEFLGDAARDQLPAPDVPVISFNEVRNLLLISMGERQVWLDPLDVKLNQGKTVAFDCRKVAETSLLADSKTNAVMGYSKVCGK